MPTVKQLAKLNRYCIDNPRIPFWEALRNWSRDEYGEGNFLYFSESRIEDTELIEEYGIKDTLYLD